MPFMEQGNGFNAMNFNIPLYDVNGNDMPQNTTIYIMQIRSYLCPSDVRDDVLPDQAPSNYASCTGHGLPGGFGLPASYGNPNGPLYLNSATTLANIHDGSSNTALLARVSDITPRLGYWFFLFDPGDHGYRSGGPYGPRKGGWC